MNKPFVIRDIGIIQENGFNILSAYLDDDFVYFKVPENTQLFLNAEWFIAIALLDAMVSGRDINVDEKVPVSKAFSDRFGELQSVFSCWNPRLKKIGLSAQISDRDHAFEKVGSYFSAGVDSSHTLVRKGDDITHLILLRVFDMGDDESWAKRIETQSGFADRQGKILIPVETNARDWTDGKGIAWGFAHGLLIAAAGGNLGMKRLYVPSSHTYDHLFPWGSHPLTDPMWGTESTTVIHHGSAARRTQKTRIILEQTDVANNLKVCWRNIDKNCGQCAKCIRTMAAVYLLGKQVDSLPPLQDMGLLKKLQPTTDSGATSLEDLIFLAKEAGNDDMYKILKKYYRRYQRKKLASMMDKSLLDGRLRRLYRYMRKPKWLELRVTLLSPERGEL
ncbi:MAG: hypothetical protein R3E57_05365 [Porticoccaceae bacterium]